jgi:hypothetical protein
VQLERVEEEIFFQDYETAIGIDEDGNVVLRKDGGQSSVGFTDKEVEELKGTTFTHNHPKGGSFSRTDIDFMLDAELKEMRAVGVHGKKRWLYRMRPNAEAYQYRELILSEANKADSETYVVFNKQISDGEITPTQAVANHFHRVWSLVDKVFGGGLGYERVEW